MSPLTAMRPLLGRGPEASGSNGVALGVDSEASGTNSTAIGRQASASQTGSFALGANSTATLANQFVFGTSVTTYVLPGITSASSLARQGAVDGLVTTDANGNLASDGGALEAG